MDSNHGITITAIPREHLRQVREGNAPVNATSAPTTERLAATGGEPLRCCLRDAREGESIILFSYQPPLPGESVYQETGPVFAHASSCPGPEDDEYPVDWLSRPQVLRAYTHDGRIHPASRVHDGTDPLAEIKAVLDADEVAVVHSRNIVYGCFMFAVHRAGGTGASDLAGPGQ
jgi:hypothetical protein